MSNTITDTRPSWDHFWFTQALMYSTRGTCDRLRTATIIVKNNRIVGAGYNGSPSGADHCDDAGHLIIEGHCERTLHGEANAIINSDRSQIKGSTAYTLGTPCLRCFKELIGAGVTTINCLGTYSNSLGKEALDALAQQTGVKLVYFDLNPQDLINEAVTRLNGKGGALFNYKNKS